MIELKEYDLPVEDYYRLISRPARNCFFWGLAYGCSVIGSFGALTGDWDVWACGVIIFLVFSAIIYFFWAGYIRRMAFSPENKAALQKRKFTFGDGTYHILCEDGSESRGPLSHFVRAEIVGDDYLLYLGKFHFYPISRSAFLSEEDRARFETEILGGKMGKPNYGKKLAIFLVVMAILFGTGFALRGYVSRGEEAECPGVSVPEE